MTELAQGFGRELGVLQAVLRGQDPGMADKPWREGGWTHKQIVGHLLDSAANNRQRGLCGRVRMGGMWGPGTPRTHGWQRMAMQSRTGRRWCAGGRWSTRFWPR